MDDATIRAIAELLTALGVGALLPKLGSAIKALFARGGISRKRDEADRLRAELSRLKSRLARLLEVNRQLRELLEAARLHIIKLGARPDIDYPPIDEDTDGP